MANQFVNLPTTVGNGVGAAVNVTTFGALKTIVCQGTADATINVEFNNDVTPNGTWAPVATFLGTGQITLNVAARWMRVRTSNYNTDKGGTTQVDMGGTDDGTTFASLPVPVGTGVGAAVDVSALPLYKTVQIGDPFRGTLIVEVSEDGTNEWAQPFSFQTPGSQSQVIAARWMRVRRVGVPMIAPGTPLVNVGACSAAGGAGDQGVAISAGTSSQATGTIDFANSNGISFGMSNGTVTGSVGAGGIGLSAGSQLAVTGTVVFSNSNGISFGMAGSSQITASVATQAGVPFGISAGSQSVSTGTLVLSNSNGISFGMAGSSQITASIGTPVLSRSEINGFVNAAPISQNILSFNAVNIPVFATITQLDFMAAMNLSTNSTGAFSMSFGVYTLSGQTASLASSTSRQFSWTSGSDTADTGQYGGASGMRYRTLGGVYNFSPGNYLFAYHLQTANAASVTFAGRLTASGVVGTYDGIETSVWLDGFSASSFSSAMPASVVVTNTNYSRIGGAAGRMPGVILQGTF